MLLTNQASELNYYSSFAEFFSGLETLKTALHRSMLTNNKEEVWHSNNLLNTLEKAERVLKAYFLLLQKKPGKIIITPDIVLGSFDAAARVWNSIPVYARTDILRAHHPESYFTSLEMLLANESEMNKTLKDSPVAAEEQTKDYL